MGKQVIAGNSGRKEMLDGMIRDGEEEMKQIKKRIVEKGEKGDNRTSGEDIFFNLRPLSFSYFLLLYLYFVT